MTTENRATTENPSNVFDTADKALLELKLWWLHKPFIEKKYDELLQAARKYANDLDAKGMDAKQLSKLVADRLREQYPNLEVIITESYDVYVDTESLKTCVYFNLFSRKK